MSRLMTIQVAEPDLSESLGTGSIASGTTIHLMSFVLDTNAYDNFHTDTTTTNVHHVQVDRVLR